MTDRERLAQAGWVRRGAFWSPPGSTAKFALRAAVAKLASSALAGARPDSTWKKTAVTDWLTTAQVSFDPTATKAELLDLAASVR